jgi:hypothetical protein
MYIGPSLKSNCCWRSLVAISAGGRRELADLGQEGSSAVMEWPATCVGSVRTRRWPQFGPRPPVVGCPRAAASDGRCSRWWRNAAAEAVEKNIMREEALAEEGDGSAGGT